MSCGSSGENSKQGRMSRGHSREVSFTLKKNHMETFQHGVISERNVNQNYNQVWAHTSQNGFCQTLRTVNGDVLEKKQFSYANAGNVNC